MNGVALLLLALLWLLAPSGPAGQPPVIVPLSQAPAPTTNAAPKRPFLVLTNLFRPKPTDKLAPGLYTASPYSMLVLVPEPTDPGILKPAPQFEPLPGEIIKPPLRLTPITPPRPLPAPKTLKELNK